jgi:hypothetical protein
MCIFGSNVSFLSMHVTHCNIHPLYKHNKRVSFLLLLYRVPQLCELSPAMAARAQTLARRYGYPIKAADLC